MNAAEQIVSAGFDIANLKLDGEQITFRVPVIFDADGEPVSGFVIVGKNSPEVQAELKVLRTTGLMQSSKRKTAIDTSTDDGASRWIDLQLGNERRLALVATVDWFGWTSGGVELPFDKAMTEKFLIAKPTWREKISAAMEADGNFLKA